MSELKKLGEDKEVLKVGYHCKGRVAANNFSQYVGMIHEAHKANVGHIEISFQYPTITEERLEEIMEDYLGVLLNGGLPSENKHDAAKAIIKEIC